MMADEVVGTAWVPQEGVSLEPAPQEDLAAIAAREAELIASARKKRYAKDRTEAGTKAFKKYRTAKQHQTRARKAARKETFNSAYDGAAGSKTDVNTSHLHSRRRSCLARKTSVQSMKNGLPLLHAGIPKVYALITHSARL